MSACWPPPYGRARGARPKCLLTFCRTLRGFSSTPHAPMARVACPEGVEPPTICLEGRCSIQLSYGHARAEVNDFLKERK